MDLGMIFNGFGHGFVGINCARSFAEFHSLVSASSWQFLQIPQLSSASPRVARNPWGGGGIDPRQLHLV